MHINTIHQWFPSNCQKKIKERALETLSKSLPNGLLVQMQIVEYLLPENTSAKIKKKKFPLLVCLVETIITRLHPSS